jgi:hypothetical protein
MLTMLLSYLLLSKPFFVSICVIIIFLLIRHVTRDQKKLAYQSTNYLDMLFYGELIAACTGATLVTNLLWDESNDKSDKSQSEN